MRWPGLLLLPLLGCTNAQPCTSCPRIEGVWFLQYVAPDFGCDGGMLEAPPSTVQIIQQGSVLRSTIDGVEMTGTLYDTADFSIAGSLARSVSMRGVYIAGAPDGGGEKIVSGLMTRQQGGCREDQRFTGGRF